MCPFYLSYPACSCRIVHDALSESLVFLYKRPWWFYIHFWSQYHVFSFCFLAAHLKAVSIVGLSKLAFGFICFLHCFSVLSLIHLCPTPCFSHLLPLKGSFILFLASSVQSQVAHLSLLCSWRHLELKKNCIYLYIYSCVCECFSVCVYPYMPWHMCGERRQPTGAISLLLSCGSWGLNEIWNAREGAGIPLA